MKRLLRWLAVGIATVLFLVLAGAVTIYVLARRALHHRFPVPHQTITLPTDSIAIAEGGRLARIRGCLGCHGDRGQGEVFFDEPGVALLVAPNLTRALATYDNSQIEGIVRHGVRPTGRGVLAMPATAFRRMSDTDFGKTLAYLRTLPPQEGPGPKLIVRPLGYLGLAIGKFRTQAGIIGDSPVGGQAPPVEDSVAYGDYLSHSICTECHGLDLQGDPESKTPPLSIVATYPLEDFTRLLRTGIARGNRELGLMSKVARGRFYLLTDGEIASLSQYLRQRGPGTPPPN